MGLIQITKIRLSSTEKCDEIGKHKTGIILNKKVSIVIPFEMRNSFCRGFKHGEQIDVFLTYKSNYEAVISRRNKYKQLCKSKSKPIKIPFVIR